MHPAGLLAVRPGDPAALARTLAPPLGPAPAPLARGRPERRAAKVVRGMASLALAGSVHALVALLVVATWQGMVRDVSAPEPIAVEVVDRIPGETAPAAKAPPPPDKPVQPPVPAPPPPPPPPPTAAAELNRALPPALVEPPPESKPAAAVTEATHPANRATDPGPQADTARGSTAEPAKPPQPPAPAPKVLTASGGDTAVAPPTRAPEAAKPPGTGDPAAAASTATALLAAALPTATMPMPLSFRAALAAQGDATDAAFRGSVFGALSRARQSVTEEARARHLSGQVVLALVLAASGEIASVAILQSSGRPDADAFAVDMVRRAAPFPPPPPGASRTFTPAISFGDG